MILKDSKVHTGSMLTVGRGAVVSIKKLEIKHEDINKYWYFCHTRYNGTNVVVHILHAGPTAQRKDQANTT